MTDFYKIPLFQLRQLGLDLDRKRGTGIEFQPAPPDLLRLVGLGELLETQACVVIDGLLRFGVEDVRHLDGALDLLDQKLEVVAGGLALAEDGGELEVVDGADEADGRVVRVGGDGGVHELASVLKVGEFAWAG